MIKIAVENIVVQSMRILLQINLNVAEFNSIKTTYLIIFKSLTILRSSLIELKLIQNKIEDKARIKLFHSLEL